MKSLLDLKISSNPNLDAQELIEYADLSIEEISSEKTLENFSLSKKEMNLSSSQVLQVSKNTTAYFDALTSKTSRIFGLKDPLMCFNYKKYKKSAQKSVFPRMHFSLPSFSQKIPSFSFPKIPLKRGFFWTWLGFFLVVFSLLWLDKIFVENRVISGYQKIINLGQTSQSLQEVSKTINNARFDFLLADIFFTPFRLLPHQDVRNGGHAISAGKYLTKSLDIGLAVYHKTEDFVNQKDIENIYFTQLLQNIAPEFQNIQQNLSQSLLHYEAIKNLGDPRLEQELNRAKEKLNNLENALVSLNTHYDALLSFLGHNEKRSYLIVLQNADEIRPTGGFMGSMGVLDIFRGKVQKFEMRDVYSFEWDLKKADYERLKPPPGIDILTDTFGLRDANYFINTRDSSENIQFFVENSGQHIDGIIYLNQNILLDFLKQTGGVYFEPVGRIIDEKNFSELMSLLVEAKIFKVGSLGSPKQVLFDFVKSYKSLVLEKKAYFEYLQIIGNHISGRDLMFYSFHPKENDFLEQAGLMGTINYNASLDFTYPVFTSLSGNKSDRYMDRTYKKEFQQNPDCSIKTRFTLSQRHTFNAEKEKTILSEIEAFQIKDENLLNIQGKGKNFQFVRVLIPHEAEVELGPDMNLVDYGKRKGIEFYTSVEPTERKDISFSYTLQNPACFPYSFVLYKQAGIPRYNVEIQNEKSKEIFSGFEEDFFYASEE